VIINMIIWGVVILDKTIILKLVSLIFFNLPLIISMILVIMFVTSIFREQEINLNKLKAAGAGILSVIITSLAMMTLPSGSLIDTIGNWILKFIVVVFILYAMADTYEERTDGIKAVSAISVALILFSLIPKIATHLGLI